jgi:hypothetical protein
MRSTGSRPAEDVNAGNATHAAACAATVKFRMNYRNRESQHGMSKYVPLRKSSPGRRVRIPAAFKLARRGLARRTAICADGTWPASDRGASRVASIERAAHGHRVESDPQEGRCARGAGSATPGLYPVIPQATGCCSHRRAATRTLLLYA